MFTVGNSQLAKLVINEDEVDIEQLLIDIKKQQLFTFGFDAICTFIFFIFIFYLRYVTYRNIAKFKKEHLKISDYSVEVNGLP